MCGCGVRGHIVLYDECTEEQQLYAWWMECPGGVCEYVEEFAFGASLVWLGAVLQICGTCTLFTCMIDVATYTFEVCHIHCARYGLGQKWREVGVACLEGKSDLKWE